MTTTAATTARVGHRGLTIHALTADGATRCGAERTFGVTRRVEPSRSSLDVVTCAKCRA